MKNWKMFLAAMALSAAMIAETVPAGAAAKRGAVRTASNAASAASAAVNSGSKTANAADSAGAAATVSDDAAGTADSGSGTIPVKEGTEISRYVLSSDPSSAGAPVTEPPDVPESQYAKTFHYSSRVTFSGIYKTNTFSFKKEEYWETRYAYAQIEFSVSPLITDGVPASLTFSVNDTPVSSCRIDYSLGETQTAYVTIPVDLLNDGYNNLSVTGYVLLYDEEGCLDDFSNANWICISENSLVRMGYDVDDSGNLLKYYPFPLVSSMDETGEECGVYVPDDATSGELTAAMMLRSQLGAGTTDSDDISIADFSAIGDRAQRLIVATQDRLPSDVKKQMPDTAGDGSSYDLSKGSLVYEYSDKKGTVLAVTAGNEKDLAEGAAMLMDDDLLAQENSSAAFVPSGTKAKVIRNRSLSDLIVDHETITGITNEKGLVFVGPFRQEQTVFLPLTGGFVLAEGGKISLSFRYSENLDFNRSLLTVYWGDTPLASKKLTKEKADGDSFSFTIPSDVVGTYASSIRIAFDLEIRDLYCTKRTDEMPWAYVSGDSTLYLPAGQSTDYSLALRPYPFQTLGLFNDLALVLPDKYTGEELELAGSVMSLMGSAISPYGSFQTVKASDYDPSAGTEDSADDKSGNNIIAIGTYQDNSLIQSLNQNLSFRFLDDGSGFDSNDQLLVSPDYGKRVGILQIIRSPYADKRAVLTVSAADTTGLESIQNYIRLQKNNRSMNGDAFLIDTDGDTSSYTFLKHEETDQVSLKEKVKQNKNAILFTLIGSMAMFILFIGVIITLVHYRRNRRDEDRK